MKKRILGILLTLCMVLCLVPTTAFAEGETNRKVETEQELVDALADSSVDIITLKNDIAIGTTLTVLRKVTLDLNGYVLKMTGSGSVIILDNKSGITGDLTLIDSNPTAEHKFKVNGVEPWVLDDSGTETVYGGIITGGTGSRIFFSNGVGGGGVIIGSGALTMNGGNIVGCIANDGGGLFLSDGSFTMNAGSIVGCSTPNRLTTGEAFHGGIYAFGPMANGDTTGVITLTGGLIKNNGRYAINAVYKTTIYANGGEVYGEVYLNQACKITCLAEDNGITAFKGKTVIGGASSVNPSHVDWGLFYGGLYIYGNTTGVIVTYKDGDSEYAKQVLPSGTLATRPDAPAATPGYTFGGWNKADGTAWDYASDKVTDNITLYAKWAANTYTITFDTAGGSEIAPITQDYGTVITAPEAPTREGYTFIGWDKEIPTTMPAENMTVTAQWEINQYTITFDTNGGSEIAPITQDYGTAITAPDDPTREGYTFIGWDTEIPTTMPAENMIITAKWKVNQYTITFDSNGGSEIAPITQDYGTAIAAPADPTREGYTFIGWDKAIPTTMPAENMTVTAQWKDIEKPTGEIKISENSWKAFLNNITFGLFFKDTQTVTITAADNSGEAVKIEYLLSDKALTESELAGMTFTAYSAPFSINPDNEYVIYAKLTDTSENVAYINTNGIVLDATVPVISGIEAGKTYCAAQTITVDEKYIGTVKVNGTEVSLDKNSQVALSPASGEQTIVVTDKAGNETRVTVTVNDGHTYEWQSENGQYWQKCKFCNHETAKKDIPTINISGADKVCRTQDYKFSFTLPEGATDAAYGYEFIGLGDGPLTPTVENGLYSGIIKASTYPAKENSFKLIVSAKTADGFEFSAEKTVAIQNAHSGGTATCTNKAVCEICGESYGELDPNNHSNLKHIDAVAATKTTEGNIEYWYCDGCNKYYKDAKATQEIAKADTVTAKLPKSPKTGDTSNLMLWIALLFISGGAVIGTTVVSKKKKHNS